jgi:hypothetical protein
MAMVSDSLQYLCMIAITQMYDINEFVGYLHFAYSLLVER